MTVGADLRMAHRIGFTCDRWGPHTQVYLYNNSQPALKNTQVCLYNNSQPALKKRRFNTCSFSLK
jgi:hypothetical protein